MARWLGILLKAQKNVKNVDDSGSTTLRTLSVPLCCVKSHQNFILPFQFFFQLNENRISLKELKVEGNKVRSLGQVEGVILKFFSLESWQEAVTIFGDSVGSDRLVLFKVKLSVHVTLYKDTC